MGSRVDRRGFWRRMLTGGAGLATWALSGPGLRGKPVADLGKGMHAIITGSGSALPDPQRGNASQAIVVDGVILQFDCGRRTMDNLMVAGVNPVDVDYILFTHLHFDHIATYDYYVISSWIAGRQTPFQVFGPLGTVTMSEGAFEGMHKMNVDFVKGIVDSWPENMARRPLAEIPITVRDVGPGTIVKTDKFEVRAVETPHITAWDMKSLGYRVDSEYGSVVISGDTAPSQDLTELAQGADLLIHECVIPDFGMTRGGKFSLKTGARREESDTKRRRTGHTSPTELGKLAQRAGVKKLVATHLAPYTSVDAAVEMSSLYLGPRQSPDIWEKFEAAIRKQYRGEILFAEDAMVVPIGG